MIKLLTLIVIALAAVTIWRLMRVLELVRDLRGEDEQITDKDNRVNGRLMLWFLALGMIGMVWFTIDAKKYLLPVAASKHGALTDDYLYINFALIIVVFFITQILLFYFAWKYQHKKGQKAFFYPVDHKLEFIWTIIPAVVLMGLIVYGLKLWVNITAPAPKEAMVIENNHTRRRGRSEQMCRDTTWVVDSGCSQNSVIAKRLSLCAIPFNMVQIAILSLSA